jgi:hypothetical protein
MLVLQILKNIFSTDKGDNDEVISFTYHSDKHLSVTTNAANLNKRWFFRLFSTKNNNIDQMPEA